MHIRPILESHANDDIKALYQDIKNTLDTTFVPLVFQVMANYPEYFHFIWERIKQNTTDPSFMQLCNEAIHFSDESMPKIYTPSQKMSLFVSHLQPLEKEHILNIVHELRPLNAKLMVITIALRESLKGIPVGVEKIAPTIEQRQQVSESFFSSMFQHVADPTSLQTMTNILVPLTGANALVVSKYPQFFSTIAQEMNEMIKTERYLHIRVLLEQLGLVLISHLTTPLATSYREFMEILRGKPYLDDFLFLLADAFPSKFPFLVLTGAVMKQVLQPQTGLVRTE